MQTCKPMKNKMKLVFINILQIVQKKIGTLLKVSFIFFLIIKTISLL